METSILSTLERAELAARERTLAASAEAESILAAARADARAIAAGVDGRIAEAIAARRERLIATARAEAASIEAESGDVASTAPDGTDSAAGAAAERAAESIVRAVLGEAGGEDC